jgi:glycerol-3-phosphate acyltransferase PlsY
VAAAFPLLVWALREYADSRQLIFVTLVSVLVIWRHRQNIGRIAAGTESKLGKKGEVNPDADAGTPSEKRLRTESGTLGASRK